MVGRGAGERKQGQGKKREGKCVHVLLFISKIQEDTAFIKKKIKLITFQRTGNIKENRVKFKRQAKIMAKIRKKAKIRHMTAELKPNLKD